MADPTVDIDQANELAGYIRVIGSRAMVLEKDVSLHDRSLTEMDSRVNADRKRARAEQEEIKEALRGLKSDVRRVQAAIISMIAQLKNTLKDADFDRFQRRVEAWAPESLVSRKEAQRVIQEIAR